MQDAYLSEDFYLTFGKLAGAIPATATKQSHANIRDQFKTVALGVLYGLSAEGLARELGVPASKGRELLQMHKETFRTLWKWSDQVEMTAILSGRIRTVFGWTLHIGQDVNPRSIRDFPMQANGAEMWRLACCLATERDIAVCAPVHDALLVEGPDSDIDQVVKRTQAAMEEASEIVLPGFPLRTEAKVVRWPERYSDPRGKATWEKVWKILERIEFSFLRNVSSLDFDPEQLRLQPEMMTGPTKVKQARHRSPCRRPKGQWPTTGYFGRFPETS
jgi:hypothetical protein